MEGENVEETGNQPLEAENGPSLNQSTTSPLAEGLLSPNIQESNNTQAEIETSNQVQQSTNENAVDSVQNEITTHVDGLLPHDETNTTQSQPSLENENQPASPEQSEQQNQSFNQDSPSPSDNPTIQPQNEVMQAASNENDSNSPEVNNNDAESPQNNESSTLPQVMMPNTARVSSHAPRHFYPSMPQTARSSKSCRFVKTKPGTSRTNPYICRKISSFSVPIVQLRASYQRMDTQLHSLVANCNIEAISPELMMVYKRVDQAYDLFCTQANLLLSSQDPNATPRQQEKTSAIYKVSEELVNEWVTFIKLFNSTIARGSTPFFQIISGRLSRILSIFRSLNERTNLGMMRIAMTRDGVRRVDSEIILLRRECNAKFRNGEHIDQTFADKVKKVTARVENVFKNSVTKATMYTAEIMRLKSDMQVEASDLKTNVDSMVNFDTSAGLTRAEIAKVNEVFNSLFQLIRLPLELKLKYEDDMSENEKAATKKDEEETKNKESTNIKTNRKPIKNSTMKVCMFENMV